MLYFAYEFAQVTELLACARGFELLRVRPPTEATL